MDYQRKNQTDPKRARAKQQQITTVPTNDVKNTNGTNKGGDLQLVNNPRTIPRGIEKNATSGLVVSVSSCTLIDTSSTRVRRDEKNLSMAWIYNKNVYDMVLQSCIKLSQNVQDIRRSHKVYQENHRNLESGIDSRGK